MLTIATTVEEAAKAKGEIRAGGTDVQARRWAGAARGSLVDIHRIQELSTIEEAADGTTLIGALVTIYQVATHPAIRNNYSGVAEAAGGLATPQIRWMATMGGALLQRSRCHFYRHPAYDCYKSGGDTCPARDGHNPNGVVFDLGPCVAPHPSTLGMALMAYEAEVSIYGRGRLSVADLYGTGTDPSRDHTLNAGEVLTHIHLPGPLAGERAAYFRAISRYEAEWPIVESVVRLNEVEGTIAFARVAAGGVANVPWRLTNVESALEGKPATQATLEQAAALATEGTHPLPQTAWKLDLLAGTILETLERALDASV